MGILFVAYAATIRSWFGILYGPSIDSIVIVGMCACVPVTPESHSTLAFTATILPSSSHARVTSAYSSLPAAASRNSSLLVAVHFTGRPVLLANMHASGASGYDCAPLLPNPPPTSSTLTWNFSFGFLSSAASLSRVPWTVWTVAHTS